MNLAVELDVGRECEGRCMDVVFLHGWRGILLFLKVLAGAGVKNYRGARVQISSR